MVVVPKPFLSVFVCPIQSLSITRIEAQQGMKMHFVRGVAILSQMMLLSIPVVMVSFSSPMQEAKYHHQQLYSIRTNTTENENRTGSLRKINNKTGQTKPHFVHPVSTQSSYHWRSPYRTGRVLFCSVDWEGCGAVLISPQATVPTAHCDKPSNQQ